MLSDYGTWWIGQLKDCVPARLRELGSSRHDALIIDPIGPIGPDLAAISICVRSKNRETPLGQFRIEARELTAIPRPAGLPVVLRLAGSDILSKTITLPLATERDLAQVLAFELDRETPFTAEEVFWRHSLVERDKQRGQLTVLLQLVPRASLDPLLASLAMADLVPKNAQIAGVSGDRATAAFRLDAEQAQSRPTGGHLLRWSAAAACLALAVGAIAVPFVRQALDLARFDRELAAGRASAKEAEQLRREIDSLASASDVIRSERAIAGDPLATLAALTNLLPDDTYLTELQQQQHRVTFGGRSATASKLIGAVAAGSQFRDPAFVSPVTRIESMHLEIFTISAEVGP